MWIFEEVKMMRLRPSADDQFYKLLQFINENV